MSNFKIFTIAGGFYFFGEEIAAPEGYIAMRNGAMFGGFSGNKGVAGVARGAAGATVILDKIDGECVFPLSAVYAVFDCIDLTQFKGATWR